jgi:hypothetical protein
MLNPEVNEDEAELFMVIVPATLVSTVTLPPPVIVPATHVLADPLAMRTLPLSPVAKLVIAVPPMETGSVPVRVVIGIPLGMSVVAKDTHVGACPADPVPVSARNFWDAALFGVTNDVAPEPVW